MRQLDKLLNIEKGEGKPAIILFAYFFFFGATLTVGKTARYAYFLNRSDITYLPLMFFLTAIVVAIIATINYIASKRYDLTRNLCHTISLSGFIFAISLILIQKNLSGFMIPFLYVWIDVITIVINFQFVMYASLVFNSRQAKRLFGIILCGSPIARIIIGAGIPPFVSQFGSNYLLTLTAGFILCCVIMAWIARPYINNGPQTSQIEYRAPDNNSTLESYFKMLALAIGAAAVATVIIEYQFLIISNREFPTEEKIESFLGIFNSVTGFISLFSQLFFTRWILSRFGILSAIRILPAGLGIGSLAILVQPSLFSVLVAKVSEQITKFTLNKTSFDLLWVPVSPDQKQRKKLFIDDTIKTAMQGLAGLFIFALVKWSLPDPVLMRFLSLAALVFIVIWLFTTSRLKNGYVSALVSAIEKRKLNFDQIRLDTTDNDIIRTIKDALNSDEEAKQVFALDLISDLYLSPWSATLNTLFKKGSPSVQAKILAMATDHPEIISDADLQNTIEEKGFLTGDALIISGKRNLTEMIPTMKNILENGQDESSEILAAAAIAVLIMNKGPCDLARSTLEKILNSEDENLKVVVLRMLNYIPDYLTDTQLRECCLSDSSNVCSAALDIAHHRYDTGLIPCVINCLKHTKTRHAARNVLEIYPSGDVAFFLNKMLIRGKTDRAHKVEIIRTLKDYPDSLSISILVHMLESPSLDIQAESIDALLEIARRKPLSAGILQQLSDESRTMAEHIYALYRMIDSIVSGPEGVLLYDLYFSEIEQRTPMLIKLLILPVPEISVERYIPYKKYDFSSQSDNLIEIIDNILPRRESIYFIPLLQDISIADRCRVGQRFFNDLPNDLDTDLTRLINSSNEYHRIIGLDYAISQSRMKVLEQIDWTVFSDQEIYCEIISKYVAENHNTLMNLPQFPRHCFPKQSKELNMLSILEKTIILRGTNLFEGVPGESIYHVAQVMEEEHLGKGAFLFEKGDKGEYFYIIVTGEILIHIGETELNKHYKGEYFGEMALLDDTPRSTSATALEETLLLKINQDNFLDVMMDHKEVRRSIMRILNERFRKLTDQYAMSNKI